MKVPFDPAGYGPPSTTSPRAGGTYALLLYLAQPAHLEVGRLGRFLFPSGYYLYLGSALGGLKGRLSRHLRWSMGAGGGGPPLRWHIDYLLAQADLLEIWWQSGREGRECAWAALARSSPNASLPVPRFGSSDCLCPGHLVYFSARPRADILKGANISTLEVATRRPGPRADRAVRPYSVGADRCVGPSSPTMADSEMIAFRVQ